MGTIGNTGTVDSVLTHTSPWTRIAMGYYRVWVSSEVSLVGVIKAKSGCISKKKLVLFLLIPFLPPK